LVISTSTGDSLSAEIALLDGNIRLGIFLHVILRQAVLAKILKKSRSAEMSNF